MIGSSGPKVQVFWDGVEIGRATTSEMFSFSPDRKGELVLRGKFRDTTIPVDGPAAYVVNWSTAWGFMGRLQITRLA